MQSASKVIIKGMACHRCILTVKKELQKAGVDATDIQLGEVILSASLDAREIKRLGDQLKPFGFTLVEDKREGVVRAVKELAYEVYNGEYDFPYRFRFSDLLTQRLQADYDKISSIFSTIENTTIEKWLIDYRIGKVKEYLVYSGLSLSDIAFKLNFSSTAHLSGQFKQHTGLNTSYFKNLKQQKQYSEK